MAIGKKDEVAIPRSSNMENILTLGIHEKNNALPFFVIDLRSTVEVSSTGKFGKTWYFDPAGLYDTDKIGSWCMCFICYMFFNLLINLFLYNHRGAANYS